MQYKHIDKRILWLYNIPISRKRSALSLSWMGNKQFDKGQQLLYG